MSLDQDLPSWTGEPPVDMKPIMPVRLRYLAHDLEVPVGQFVVGRSADCQLSLDDPLVSRRHALLTVGAQGVAIEDLGSRNGVLVNGNKIEGQRRLADGDRITIGGQTMTLHASGAVPWSDAPGAASARTDEEPHYRAQTQTLVMQQEELRADDDIDPTTSIGTSPFTGSARQPDKRVHGLSLIGGVADKALAMGRAEEAERLLQRALGDVLAKARAGDEVQHELVEQAAYYAARLAAATGRGAWVDLIFELYASIDELMPAPLIDELYRVVRKVKSIDMAALGAYTEALRVRAPSFGPTERFLQQRIEGLERLSALK